MTTALADHAMEWMKSMQAGSREERVDLLFAYLNTHGQSSYDPSVTQLEHALQTAHLAQQESHQPHLVVASLLHDIGHLMIDEHDEQRDFLDQDCAHEAVAARALSVFFPTQVVAPVQRHVSAKRLLCSLDETYYAGLSDASKRSFAVQGGELSRSEAMRLLALEGMDDAMALRRWDDRAKVHGVEVPELDAYRQVVLNHLL